MILVGVILGLAFGVAAGGSISNLLSVRIRYGMLVLVALGIRYGTQWLAGSEFGLNADLQLLLLSSSFAILVGALWANRSEPGLLLVMTGIVANGLAVVVNGGQMPVFLPALGVAGIGVEELSDVIHTPLPEPLDLDFLLRAGPLGDILPIPIPLLANVVSIGDMLVAVGITWFLFTAVSTGSPDVDDGVVAFWGGRPRADTEATREQVGLDRPVVLGGGMGPGLSSVAASEGARTATKPRRATEVVSRPAPLTERIRQHPYVRLAQDARFSAFWLAGTISLLGDRLHQIALGVLVFSVTGSALQTGFVFLAATLPNLILGPFAGTFVDRWDQKRVMITSDLLRAGLVLTIPFVADLNILLVYPLVFVITTISLFFRPARIAVLPRIVRREDLTPANAAIWTGESIADIAGYPLAGLFVASLGTDLALAFWVDAVTYLISAVLLAGLIIPPVVRTVGPRAVGAIRAFMKELQEGWDFLRGDDSLFQNTLVSIVAQMSIGAMLALAVVYADRALDGDVIPFPQNYAVLEAAIGVGNLIGGFIVGAVGARLRKGWMVVSGFAVMGFSVLILGLTSNELIAAGAAMTAGIFNLVYLIPSQTLFAERTPQGMMGRVVAIRTSMVMGALTGAMAVSSILTEYIDVGTIIAATGILTLVASGIAALLPAVRDV